MKTNTEQETKEVEVVKVNDKRTPIPVEKSMEITQDSPNAIVMLAIQKGYDPAFIEKMMNLAERNQKNIARQQFFEAVANFKEEAPPVAKDKWNNQYGSWYTSLGNLLETYNPFLGKHGLSISFPTPKQTPKDMTVECRLSHRGGHSESISMSGPILEGATGKISGEKSRNAIQDIKTTFTYLRSATCEAVLGVAGTEATANNDGNTAKSGPINDKQVSRITDMIDDIKGNRDAIEASFLKHMGYESVEEIPSSDFQKAVAALKATKKARSDG